MNQPTDTTLTLLATRVPVELADSIRALAAQERRSVAGQIRVMLEDSLKNTRVPA